MGISTILPLRLKLFGLHSLSQLRHLLVGKNVRALLVESRNGLLLVDLEDRAIGSPLAARGEYSWNEIERLKSYIDRNSDLLVVGAHVGSIVVPVCRYCRSVVAIEANPRTFRLLELNLRINNCSNVSAINIAANDKDEDLQFVLNRVNSGGSKRMPVIRDFMYFYDRPEVAIVQAKPLDELLPSCHPSVILMDIEGSEYFALRGMQRLLGDAKVFVMEFLPHHLKNVSGTRVADLLALIKPHFTSLFIPAKQLTVPAREFETTLQRMYDADEGDEGIIFTK